jgi:hypothetical protein
MGQALGVRHWNSAKGCHFRGRDPTHSHASRLGAATVCPVCIGVAARDSPLRNQSVFSGLRDFGVVDARACIKGEIPWKS